MGIIFEIREVHLPSMDRDVDYTAGLNEFVASYLFYRRIALISDLDDRELASFVRDTNYLNVERFIGGPPDHAMLEALDELMEDVDYYVTKSLLLDMKHVLTTHPFMWSDHELTYATYDNPRADRCEDLMDYEADLRMIENFWEEGEYYSPPSLTNRYSHLGSESTDKTVSMEDLLE